MIQSAPHNHINIIMNYGNGENSNTTTTGWDNDNGMLTNFTNYHFCDTATTNANDNANSSITANNNTAGDPTNISATSSSAPGPSNNNNSYLHPTSTTTPQTNNTNNNNMTTNNSYYGTDPTTAGINYNASTATGYTLNMPAAAGGGQYEYTTQPTAYPHPHPHPPPIGTSDHHTCYTDPQQQQQQPQQLIGGGGGGGPYEYEYEYTTTTMAASPNPNNNPTHHHQQQPPQFTLETTTNNRRRTRNNESVSPSIIMLDNTNTSLPTTTTTTTTTTNNMNMNDPYGFNTTANNNGTSGSGGSGSSNSNTVNVDPLPLNNNYGQTNTNLGNTTTANNSAIVNTNNNNNNNNNSTVGGGGGGGDNNNNTLDYCDALLRGMDDASLGWLTGAFGAPTTTTNLHHNPGGGGASGTAATTTTTTGANNGINNANHASLQQGQQQQPGGCNGYNNAYTTMAMGGGLTTATAAGGGGGNVMGGPPHSSNQGGGFGPLFGFGTDQLSLPTQQQQQQTTQTNLQGGTALDAYFVAQQQQQQQLATAQFNLPVKNTYVRAGMSSGGVPQRSNSTTRATTTRSSSRGVVGVQKQNSRINNTTAIMPTVSSHHQPSGRDHSSLPSVQIDPLLEQVSLTVTAVSLSPLSGNEVVRHIRTKTDDVITRFLPCVDFLVNCQQELRQGLQMAQRSRGRGHHGRRGGNLGGMTPRQFHITYVAPLPQRFERHNESIMAGTHLRTARTTLEGLVREANGAIPQGCDHVKNTFLGGMRENQSWGLRKWLSKHGGAGSICNDLEEVMRHVKGLNKEEDTTKRLAGMLRPIAKQAHDRLKKDVPAAYQEQSSAHPYLPFFHRLEACLKQMATYDPEEDDVICLDDSEDEDDEIKVVVPKMVVSTPNAAGSSAVRKRGGATTPAKQSLVKPAKRKSEEDVDMSDTKRSRIGTDDYFFGGGEGTTTNNNAVKSEEKASPKKVKEEPEIICLDSSDEEDGNDDLQQQQADNTAATKVETTGGLNDFLEELGHASLTPPLAPAAAAGVGTVSTQGYQFGQTQMKSAQEQQQQHSHTTTAGSIDAPTNQWRCNQCTFLNESFAAKCVMCNDDDSAGGGNSSDELAQFLGGSSFLEGGMSNHSFSETGSGTISRKNSVVDVAAAATGNSLDEASTDAQQQQNHALQSADARELEQLATHITNDGSLPKQAHRNIDIFWGTMDTLPRLLLLFRGILQRSASLRLLEPVDECSLSLAGLPAYRDVVRHPLCFHEIISSLSRSEDAVKFPHLTMRLSTGKLTAHKGNGLGKWNMWNGVHLIEAIDLVLLNAIAYSKHGGSHGTKATEILRSMLWDGVNGILKEKLEGKERKTHTPTKRRRDSTFVVVKQQGSKSER